MLKTYKKKITKRKIKKTKKHLKHTGGTILKNSHNGPTNPITEQDIVDFVNLISNHKLYTANFDALCRENPILLKIFHTPTDCDVLFLNLLSKRKIVTEIINVTVGQKTLQKTGTGQTTLKATINNVTHFLENNSCEIPTKPTQKHEIKKENNNNNKDIKGTVSTIVSNIFNKGFSSEVIKPILQIQQDDTYQVKELKKILLEEYEDPKKEELYVRQIRDILEIYFGISDIKDTKLCQLVNVIFNLSRFVAFFNSSSITSTTNTNSTNQALSYKSILKLEKLSKENIRFLTSHTNELLIQKLEEFCKYYPSVKSSKQAGGGFFSSGWSAIKQFFGRGGAGLLLLSLELFQLIIQGGSLVISAVTKIGKYSFYEKIYKAKFFNNFYANIRNTLFSTTFGTWDSTIVEIHLKILPKLLRLNHYDINTEFIESLETPDKKQKKDIEDEKKDIIEEYKILIPIITRIFPSNDKNYIKRISKEISQNTQLQKILTEKCGITEHNKQLFYLYYRRRNYISLLRKFIIIEVIKKKEAEIDTDEKTAILEILKKDLFFQDDVKNETLQYFIDENLKIIDYFALDCRNFKNVRVKNIISTNTENPDYSIYDKYKKQIITQNSAEILINFKLVNIEQYKKNERRTNNISHTEVNIDFEFDGIDLPNYSDLGIPYDVQESLNRNDDNGGSGLYTVPVPVTVASNYNNFSVNESDTGSATGNDDELSVDSEMFQPDSAYGFKPSNLEN